MRLLRPLSYLEDLAPLGEPSLLARRVGREPIEARQRRVEAPQVDLGTHRERDDRAETVHPLIEPAESPLAVLVSSRAKRLRPLQVVLGVLLLLEEALQGRQRSGWSQAR